MSCLLIVGVAAVVLLRFAWPAAIMVFAFSGVTSPGTMAGVLILLTVLAAIALREKLNGRPF